MVKFKRPYISSVFIAKIFIAQRGDYLGDFYTAKKMHNAKVYLFVLWLSLTGTTASETADVVENVSKCPQLLSALNELHGRISREEEKRLSLEKELEKVKETLETAGKGKKVAFYARLGQSYQDIQPWETIVFSSVVTNIGEAYDAVNGEFTAPFEGVYAFYSNILSNPNLSIETALQVNGQNVMYAYSGGMNYYGSGSNMAVLQLNASDVVKMVKHGPWGTQPFYIHHAWSTFSGYLV